MVYERPRGNGGVYEYFSCLSRQPRGPSCGAQYVPVDAAEAAIERHYRSVELSSEQCEAIRAHIREQVEARLLVARRQSEHHARRLRVLQDEQQKLVHLYYRGAVSEEVLARENDRIETERAQARRLVEAAALEGEDVLAALDEALAIVERCHATYLAASPKTRRLMNQAIFERILVQVDDVDGQPKPLYAELTRLAEESIVPRRDPDDPRTRRTTKARRGEHDEGPRSLRGLGSNIDQLVRHPRD